MKKPKANTDKLAVIKEKFKKYRDVQNKNNSK
ncbi:MAG: hypothetical protein DELT_03249 [Desulfovibrio sp.]